MGKLFALTSINSYESINLKCDPEKALLLREQYAGIIPVYHMGKKHWNTVSIDGSVPSELLLQLIEDSYNLVVLKLRKEG